MQPQEAGASDNQNLNQGITMQPITNLLNSQPEHSQQQTQSQTITSQVVDQIFTRMTAIYGTAWLSQFPNETLLKLAKKEWVESLHNIDVSRIKKAFKQVKDSGDAFTPSLPKFLSYCKENKDWQHRGGAYKQFQKALPKPVNREIGRGALANLKSSIRKTDNKPNKRERSVPTPEEMKLESEHQA